MFRRVLGIVVAVFFAILLIGAVLERVRAAKSEVAVVTGQKKSNCQECCSHTREAVAAMRSMSVNVSALTTAFLSVIEKKTPEFPARFVVHTSPTVTILQEEIIERPVKNPKKNR